MLHADIAAAGADRLVERVVGAGGAELLAVARAKTADRGIVEQYLANRAQGRLIECAGRALGQGIEAANAFEHLAEEIEAQRLGRPRRIEVDDASADGEFARFAYRVGADVPIVAEEALQPVEPDPPARAQAQHPTVEDAARGYALDQRVDRGQHDERGVTAAGRQPGQGVDAPADDFVVRRDPVVRQAV